MTNLGSAGTLDVTTLGMAVGASIPAAVASSSIGTAVNLFTASFSPTTNELTVNNAGGSDVSLFTPGSSATPQQLGFPAGTVSVLAGGQAVSANIDWAAGFTAASGPATGSYDYYTPVSVFDSAGTSHAANIYFVKAANGDGTWNTGNWNAYVVTDAGTPDQNGNITTHNYQSQLIGNTSMTFDENGQLTSSQGPFNVTLSWAASSQTISLNFGNQNGQCTQYGSADSTEFQTADGYAAGGLTGFNTKADGTIDGVYDNGQEIPLAQIVLTKFNAPTQLAKQGNNLYAATDGSGAGTLLTPGTGGAGTVSGDSLEASNVDEATQFETMISLQNAFGMNSTVMKSVNDMYTNLINIKS